MKKEEGKEKKASGEKRNIAQAKYRIGMQQQKGRNIKR